jgi:hypothetical protein
MAHAMTARHGIDSLNRKRLSRWQLFDYVLSAALVNQTQDDFMEGGGNLRLVVMRGSGLSFSRERFGEDIGSGEGGVEEGGGLGLFESAVHKERSIKSGGL